MKKITSFLLLFILLLCKESYAVSCVSGDVNHDGTVNILDVVSIISHTLGGNQLSAEAQVCANMNSDEKINILDIVSVVNIVIGGNSIVMQMEIDGKRKITKTGMELCEAF